MDQPLKNIFLILLIFTVLGVFTFLLRIERVEMSAESADKLDLLVQHTSVLLHYSDRLLSVDHRDLNLEFYTLLY
jgi:TM2 domain-containing membrane protein YozV